MRILVIAPFPLDVAGGAATVVHALNRGYVARGHEVVTGATSGGDHALSGLETSRVWAQFQNVRRQGGAMRLTRLARDVEADVVHVHNFAGLSAAAVGGILCPTLITLHDHYALCHRGGFVKEDRSLCPGPGLRCLTCVGRGGRRELHRPLRVGQIRAHLEKTQVVSPSRDGAELLREHGYTNARSIPNGVDLDVFRKAPPPVPAEDGALRVLGIGRASAAKGVRVAVGAVERLNERGTPARLTWVGARAPAAITGMDAPHCEGLPPEPADGIARRIAAADVVVMPSLARETFGLAAAEAMACGRPVVASRRGGLPEVLADAGVLVPAGDVAALADALADLASAPETRAQLGRRAAARARTEFAWQPIADRYLELLADLVRDDEN